MAPKRKHNSYMAADPTSQQKLPATAAQEYARTLGHSPYPITSVERYKPLIDSQSAFFLRLPREIRDLIYDRIWRDAETTTQRFQNIGWDMTYDGANDPLDFTIGAKVNSAKWLLTNKQMLKEGIQQLHQNTTCHLSDGDNTMSFRPDNPRLLTPFQARSYAIHLQREPFIFDEAQRTYRINSVARIQLNRTVGRTDPTSPIHSFQIHIRRPIQEPALAKSKADFRFDLRHLEPLTRHKKLRRFEVHVVCDIDDSAILATHWRVNRGTRARRLEDHYFDTLGVEITRVGKLLIEGGNKSGYMKETTRESDGSRELRWVWIFEKP